MPVMQIKNRKTSIHHLPILTVNGIVFKYLINLILVQGLHQPEKNSKTFFFFKVKASFLALQLLMKLEQLVKDDVQLLE